MRDVFGLTVVLTVAAPLSDNARRRDGHNKGPVERGGVMGMDEEKGKKAEQQTEKDRHSRFLENVCPFSFSP